MWCSTSSRVAWAGVWRSRVARSSGPRARSKGRAASAASWASRAAAGASWIEERERRGRLNLLGGLAVEQQEGGAQGLVARDQGVQALLQCGYIQRAAQVDDQRHMIRRAGRVELGQQPEPLLQRRRQRGVARLRA